MKVYVNTPFGTKLHGYIEGQIFVRRIDASSVRWSDRSLCVKEQAVKQAKDAGVLLVVFRVTSQKGITEYTMSLEKILTYSPVTNEHGEVDYRIPIQDCTDRVLESKIQLPSAFEKKEITNQMKLI